MLAPYGHLLVSHVCLLSAFSIMSASIQAYAANRVLSRGAALRIRTLVCHRTIARRHKFETQFCHPSVPPHAYPRASPGNSNVSYNSHR